MKKGLNREIVLAISELKQEPGWMTDFRLKALQIFEQKPMPQWGPDLSDFSMDELSFYTKSVVRKQKDWSDVPDSIRQVFEKLGVPQAERSLLAGVGAQFESEIIYKKLKEKWAQKGVVFLDTDSALKEYPKLFKKYFSTVVPVYDNKFAALNSAVWSGGSFVYVPQGVVVDQPLQAYFRIDSQSMGQFERTLIITESDSFLHYVEGCSAPVYQASSLHSAVVEIVALKNSHIRYTTIQNWSDNVYNLVTKRAHAYERAIVEWIDGNFGSKITMKYPCILLKGKKSKGQIISISVAGSGKHLDSGGKIIHAADQTTSNIIAKSITKKGGCSTSRWLLKVNEKVNDIFSRVQCDALLLDNASPAYTYPVIDVASQKVRIEHEASVSNISEEQLFYLQAKGFSCQQSRALIVNGFIDCFVNQLPMEYAIEINRLINYEMEI